MDALIALYEAAIPYAERKPGDDVRAMACSPMHVLGIARREREFAGFFILFCGPSVAMLEYLAVPDHVRGSGTGSFLYQSAREAAGARPLIVEIECPDAPAPAEEQALRRRRLDFYRRMGCRLVRDVDYILPLPTAEEAPTISLLLDNYTSNSVQARTMAEWFEELYVNVYGCAVDDPRLMRTVAMLPDLVRLG